MNIINKYICINIYKYKGVPADGVPADGVTPQAAARECASPEGASPEKTLTEGATSAAEGSTSAVAPQDSSATEVSCETVAPASEDPVAVVSASEPKALEAEFEAAAEGDTTKTSTRLSGRDLTAAMDAVYPTATGHVGYNHEQAELKLQEFIAQTKREEIPVKNIGSLHTFPFMQQMSDGILSAEGAEDLAEKEKALNASVESAKSVHHALKQSTAKVQAHKTKMVKGKKLLRDKEAAQKAQQEFQAHIYYIIFYIYYILYIIYIVYIFYIYGSARAC